MFKPTFIVTILFLITIVNADGYILDVNVTGIPDTIADSCSVPFSIVIENCTDNALLFDVFISAQLTKEDKVLTIPCEPPRRNFAISNKIRQFGGTLIAAELYDTIVTDTGSILKADSLKTIDTTMFDKKQQLLHKIKLLEALNSSKKHVIKKRSVNTGRYTLLLQIRFEDRFDDWRIRFVFPFVVVVNN